MIKVTKERFQDVEVADLLINIYGYENNKTFDEHRKICMGLLREK